MEDIDDELFDCKNRLLRNPKEKHKESKKTRSKQSSLLTQLPVFLIVLAHCIAKCLKGIVNMLKAARPWDSAPGSTSSGKQHKTTTMQHYYDNNNNNNNNNTIIVPTSAKNETEKLGQDKIISCCYIHSPQTDEDEDRNYSAIEQGLATTTIGIVDGDGHGEDDNRHVPSEEVDDADTEDEADTEDDDDTSASGIFGNNASMIRFLRRASKKGKDNTIFVLRKYMIDHINCERGLFTGAMSTTTGMPDGKGFFEYAEETHSYDEADCIQKGQALMPGCRRRLSKLTEGDLYEGEFKHGHKHGTGVMRFSDGRMFEGKYQHGQMMQGNMTNKDGCVVQEVNDDGMPQDGPRGHCVLQEDKSMYEGEFRDGSFHGHGKMTWNDGGWYVGEWRNGKMHGYGKEMRPDGNVGNVDDADGSGGQSIESPTNTGSVFCVFPLMPPETMIRCEPHYGLLVTNKQDEDEDEDDDDQEDYESTPINTASNGTNDDTLFVTIKLVDPYGDKGEYTGALSKSTGKPNGKGRLNFEKEGQWYEGDWIHGRWTGYGRLSIGDGDFYEGGLKNDHKHGRGVMHFADGRVYEGQYIRGQMIQGKMTYQDGSVYEGGWVDGRRHGRGKCIFVDGSEYEGEFREGNFHGFGQMTWNDGGWYVGEWSDGKMHGRGKEIRPDGSVRHDGGWSRGQPIRSSTFTGPFFDTLVRSRSQSELTRTRYFCPPESAPSHSKRFS